jgi:hypothetical protein
MTLRRAHGVKSTPQHLVGCGSTVEDVASNKDRIDLAVASERGNSFDSFKPLLTKYGRRVSLDRTEWFAELPVSCMEERDRQLLVLLAPDNLRKRVLY